MRQLTWRLAVSAALMAAVVGVCLLLPNSHRAMVALTMVLAIVGLAAKWGWAEALTGAVVAGLGFDYYFLLPRGFGAANPEDWFDLAAFLVTAVVVGQLVARSGRQRIHAVTQQNETDKLYKLVNALLESGNAESTLPQLADRLVEIFGAGGVALYDQHSGQVYRSGPLAAAISDQALHETATSGRQIVDAQSGLSLAPVRHGGELVGSLGMSGATLSEPLLGSIAGRVGLGLARLYAIEMTTEAEAARQSEELKSALLDAMAHEIRSPLNSIKLAATTLLSGPGSSDLQTREMLAIIDEEADRMDRFLDESVRLARMEASDLSLHKEPHDLTRLIPAAVQEMGALMALRPLRMNLPSLPPAECDQEMIARVLKQLLSNALKYSPPGSPLSVSANFTGEAIVIHVADRGPGVAEEERERIFEKFYRGRAARTYAPGTGLGLSSARSIVQAHGGKIWVSAAPDGGAAFHISLPVAAAGPMAGASHTVGAT